MRLYYNNMFIDLGTFIFLNVFLVIAFIIGAKFRGMVGMSFVVILIFGLFSMYWIMSTVPDIGVRGGTTTETYENGTIIKQIKEPDLYVIGDGDPTTTEQQIILAYIYFAMAMLVTFVFFMVMFSHRIL